MTEEILRKECIDKEFYSFGTFKIFERRMKKFGLRLKSITFLGLFSPVLIGGFVAAFSTDSEILKSILLPLCGFITVLQALLSLLSLVFKWDDKFAHSLNSIQENTRLANEFGKLSKESSAKIKRDLPKIRKDYELQEARDNTQELTKKEHNYAMRNALFQFKKKCVTCQEIPKNLKPTTCDTCGNF